LLGNKVACTACYKKYQGERTPDEVCEHCAKVIGRRARANLIGGETVVCTPCYRKHQKALAAEARAAAEAAKPTTAKRPRKGPDVGDGAGTGRGPGVPVRRKAA
jgi:hypothetical protein